MVIPCCVIRNNQAKRNYIYVYKKKETKKTKTKRQIKKRVKL